MRSKKVTAGRGVRGTHTLRDHRESYTDEFGAESDALRPKNSVSWAKNSKSTHTKRGPTRVSPRVSYYRYPTGLCDSQMSKVKTPAMTPAINRVEILG